MLLYTMVLIFMAMEFFVKGDGEEDEESKEKQEIKTTTDINRRYDAQMLRGWYAVEVLMALATIISNMVFVLARGCSRIRIIGTRTTAVVHKDTDMLEEQHILVCLFSSFIAPLIISICLFTFGFESYPELTNTVWEWLFNLMVY